MSNVSHSTLTGVDLHEPKGVSSAASGTVYIADGAGSGAWNSVSTSLNFVGMLADFATPIAPTGWLECTGAPVSRTTYSALWSAVSIQQSGTRSSGSPTITGLSSTANMAVGYFVGGSGIGLGTTITAINSATSITLSANAVSSGTSTVIVSPWYQGDGSTTFNLPSLSYDGRYRRSRSSSLPMGAGLASQNLAHTHGPGTLSTTHTHNITDPGHTHTGATGYYVGQGSLTAAAGSGASFSSVQSPTNTWGVLSQTTGITVDSATPTVTGATASDGSTEARPITVVFMTCIKY